MPPSSATKALQNKCTQGKLKSVLYFLKYSFVLVGRNTGIIRPTVYLGVLSLIMTSLFFSALFCFFSLSHIGTGVLLLVILVLIFGPLRFFIRTFLKAIQSWMSYCTITGQPVLYRDARRHTLQRTSGLMFIGFVDMLIAGMKSQRSNEGGVFSFLSGLFLSALTEVWDLLNHYMIPAVVVEGKPLMQSLPEIKAIRDNVPATLMGVFGVDFAGDALRGIMFLPYLLILAIGAGLGYLLGPHFPTISWKIGGHLVCWMPPLVALYLNCTIGGVLKACVESVKTIYFTIFYTSIMHSDQIPEESREQLAGYLRMESAMQSAGD
ncbi:MAG: hypothetical protein K8R87_03235 [Verrucomicrobia bacterium]|nr:hypothetical protein [Verrucomicrobiota bacterium]